MQKRIKIALRNEIKENFDPPPKKRIHRLLMVIEIINLTHLTKNT